MERTVDFKVASNERIASGVYRLALVGDASGIERAGQFVNVKLNGFFLRRPISVCDLDGDRLTLIYKVVGRGTEYMSTLQENDILNVLIGLGNGYDLSLAGDKPLLVGGGVGAPPLYLLAKKLLQIGKRPAVVLGFNRRDEVFLEEEFKALGVDVTVTTVDGSYGVKGFVTDGINGDFSHYYACGPYPMLKALATTLDMGGSVSLEERMGCGFGACMGCSIPTLNGVKRVCKEGPVFDVKEVIW